MEKRIVAVFSAAVLLLFGSVWRIASLAQSSDLAAAAVQQSTYLLQIYHSRGMIYDRNGQPLVNQTFRTVAAVDPSAEGMLALRSYFSGEEEWQSWLAQRRPFLLTVDERAQEKEGIRLFSVPQRFDGSLAAHLIGYVDGAGQGQSGIERAWDSFLADAGETVSGRYRIDTMGRPLPEEAEQILLEGSASDGVVLTLDRTVQKACEAALAQLAVNGAAVVMDVHTGEILAMASTPIFDPQKVADYLDRSDGPLINRALSAWAVGSSFKLLVAAAALEAGVSPQTVFCCEGYEDVEGQIFRCNLLSGHGELTMKEAVAQSCNCYFIRLAQTVGTEALLQMAQRFGFGCEDQLCKDLFSAAGTLPSWEQLQNPAELANFSFGQGYLTATPIQICKMVAAIAAGGEMPQPQVIAGTVEDSRFVSADRFSKNRVISQETARQLLEMMCFAVTDGTGQQAQIFPGAAGKTASAQTGQYDSEGNEIVHAWFAGCFPASSPQYALVVFLENGQSGNRTAAPVFAQIAGKILK